MSFAPSFVIGFLFGSANAALWYFGRRWWLSKKGALALFKLGLLGLAIWFLITKLQADPAGFLIGFGTTLALFLAGMLKWN